MPSAQRQHTLYSVPGCFGPSHGPSQESLGSAGDQGIWISASTRCLSTPTRRRKLLRRKPIPMITAQTPITMIWATMETTKSWTTRLETRKT